MALQLSVDEQLLPPEFLPQDATPAGMVTDSGDNSKTPSPTPRAPYAGQVPPAPQPQVPATKAAQLANLIDEWVQEDKAVDGDDEWAEAVKWAEEATKPE